MTTGYYRTVSILDRLIMEPVEGNIQEAIDIIANNEAYERYFFNKITDTKWFFPLKEKGYFRPEKAPGPKPVDEKGSVTMPVWNVLPYLESVSKQVDVPKNRGCITELLNIIGDVTEFHKKTKALDNSTTWSYFSKIMLNIPKNKIPVEIIDQVTIWLDTKYPSMFLSHDITLGLLPKFLEGKITKRDITKTERIFGNLFEIRWKERPEDYIERVAGLRDKPYLLVDQHWLADSLINKKYAQKIGEKCSEKPVRMLADRLKTIFRREHTPSSFDMHAEDKRYRIIVKHASEYEFSCFGGLIDDTSYNEVREQEKSQGRMLFIPDKQFEFALTDCRNAVDFSHQMIMNLKELCHGDPESDISIRMEGFYEYMMRDYSYIWCRNIADPPKYIPTDVKELITYILREVIMARVRIDTTFGRRIIEEFSGENYQYAIFTRIALLMITEYWDRYNSLFSGFLLLKSGELIFNDLHYEAELYTLLEKNVLEMDEGTKSRLKSIIEKGPQKHSFDNSEEREKYVIRWKQKWYGALKADAEFAYLHKRYRKLTKTKDRVIFKEPGVQIRSGPGPSPLSVEQILSMPNNEIAEFLTAFTTKDWWEGPTEDALSDRLKVSAKNQPEKFVDAISIFRNVSYKYVVDILWGLREAWNSKKTFHWGKLFDFIIDYINRNAFWEDKLPIRGDHWKPNHLWAINTIGTLIQDGTREDSWAFDEVHNEKAQAVIELIMTKEHIVDLKSDKTEEDPQYISDIHNTPLGNSILALVYLSLRIARLQTAKEKLVKPDDKNWSEGLKRLYERTFENDIIEAYTVFGQFLPNLIYLDREWSESKIECLEQPKEDRFWRAFMTGYLSTARVYDSIYNLPSMQRHYRKALATMTASKYITERIVHHVVIGYMRGDNELFSIILTKWQPKQIMEVIEFFSRESTYLLKSDMEDRELLIQRILNCWEKIYEKYKAVSALSEDDKQILSAVIRLTVYVGEIDRTKYAWLMLSAPYVHIDGNERWLLEYLDNLKDRGENKVEVARCILQIMLKAFESRVFWFAQESMISIVDYVYGLGDREVKEMADKICNTLGASGVDYLRSTYEKYNS